MKNYSLLCALTLLTAVAASGCGSSDVQTISGDISDAGMTETVTAPTGSDEAIAPTPTTDPADNNPDPGPGGGGSGGGGGGGGGGTRPDLADLADVDISVLDDPTPPPPPPPPDNGGNVGGGSVGESQDLGCYHDDPRSSLRVRLDGAGLGTQDELENYQGCTML